MKITKISYSMTRQVTQFHPAVFALEAEVNEDDNTLEACRALQELTIRILYKDKPIERDSLIKQLIQSDKPDVVVEQILSPKQVIKLDDEEDILPF